MSGTCYDMREATTFERIEKQVAKRLHETGQKEALVSIIFARPESVVFHDLKANFAYYNLRSGTEWDLYFAGYGGSSYRPWGRFSEWNRGWSKKKPGSFSVADFVSLADEVSRHHAWGLKAASELPTKQDKWHYSGRCDLVSIMAYPGDRRLIWDWISLRSFTLTDGKGEYQAFNLDEVIELASRWRQDPSGLWLFAPGEPPETASVLSLGEVLKATIATMTAGVVGNVAYDLLKRLL